MAGERTIEEEIKLLDVKINQLKREYDQYFLGTRPREPVLLAGEVRKLIAMLSNSPIQNTGLKFKFSSTVSRYQAFNRQWQDTLRKIEQGTYERHQFKAHLHQAGRSPTSPVPSGGRAGDGALYSAYIEARKACGQDVADLSPAKLKTVLKKQERSLRERFGSDADIRFRVVVENGRAKLKASRTGS